MGNVSRCSKMVEVDGERALEQGRGSYARGDWQDAFDALRANGQEPLAPGDLELLARSAYMLGLDDEYRGALELAYHAYRDAPDASRAARCAWWIGHNLLFLGQSAPARGWFARGRRLLEREDRDSVERGYLLIPTLLERCGQGDFEAAHATAAEIAEIGERFRDHDLVALALMEKGNALVRQGWTEDGLRLADETMVAVTAGELSPVVAGIVYCNMIAFCRDVFELRRAREWTVALTRWCEQQREMVAHKGLCLVHRAEIMTLGGAWQDALEEARRVSEQFTRGVLNRRALGHAAYRQAEVHRLWTRVPAPVGESDHGLTPRELEVLRLIARGKSNREIAGALVISERTVARHVQSIFAKLRVSLRSSASVFAAENDLL